MTAQADRMVMFRLGVEADPAAQRALTAFGDAHLAQAKRAREGWASLSREMAADLERIAKRSQPVGRSVARPGQIPTTQPLSKPLGEPITPRPMRQTEIEREQKIKLKVELSEAEIQRVLERERSLRARVTEAVTRPSPNTFRPSAEIPVEDVRTRGATRAAEDLWRRHEEAARLARETSERARREAERAEQATARAKAAPSAESVAAASEARKQAVAAIREEEKALKDLQRTYDQASKAAVRAADTQAAATVRAGKEARRDREKEIRETQKAAEQAARERTKTEKSAIRERAKTEAAAARERAKAEREATRERVQSEREVARESARVQRSGASAARGFLRGSKKAFRGATDVAEGIAFSGLLDEETVEGVIRGIIKIKATFGILRGSVEMVDGLTQAWRAYRASVAAAAAAHGVLNTAQAVSTRAAMAKAVAVQAPLGVGQRIAEAAAATTAAAAGGAAVAGGGAAAGGAAAKVLTVAGGATTATVSMGIIATLAAVAAGKVVTETLASIRKNGFGAGAAPGTLTGKIADKEAAVLQWAYNAQVPSEEERNRAKREGRTISPLGAAPGFPNTGNFISDIVAWATQGTVGQGTVALNRYMGGELERRRRSDIGLQESTLGQSHAEEMASRQRMDEELAAEQRRLKMETRARREEQAISGDFRRRGYRPDRPVDYAERVGRRMDLDLELREAEEKTRRAIDEHMKPYKGAAPEWQQKEERDKAVSTALEDESRIHQRRREALAREQNATMQMAMAQEEAAKQEASVRRQREDVTDQRAQAEQDLMRFRATGMIRSRETGQDIQGAGAQAAVQARHVELAKLYEEEQQALERQLRVTEKRRDVEMEASRNKIQAAETVIQKTEAEITMRRQAAMTHKEKIEAAEERFGAMQPWEREQLRQLSARAEAGGRLSEPELQKLTQLGLSRPAEFAKQQRRATTKEEGGLPGFQVSDEKEGFERESRIVRELETVQGKNRESWKAAVAKDDKAFKELGDTIKGILEDQNRLVEEIKNENSRRYNEFKAQMEAVRQRDQLQRKQDQFANQTGRR